MTWSAGAKPRCNSEHFWHLDNLSLQSLISADSCFESLLIDRSQRVAKRMIRCRRYLVLRGSCICGNNHQWSPEVAAALSMAPWFNTQIAHESHPSKHWEPSHAETWDSKSTYTSELHSEPTWNPVLLYFAESLSESLKPFCYVVGSACTSIVRKNCELPSFDAMEDYCGDLVEVRILRQLIFSFFLPRLLVSSRYLAVLVDIFPSFKKRNQIFQKCSAKLK